MTKLKLARETKGLACDDVAETIGTTAQTLLRWEEGVFYPKAPNLRALAKVYNVSVDDLVENEY